MVHAQVVTNTFYTPEFLHTSPHQLLGVLRGAPLYEGARPRFALLFYRAFPHKIGNGRARTAATSSGSLSGGGGQ